MNDSEIINLSDDNNVCGEIASIRLSQDPIVTEISEHNQTVYIVDRGTWSETRVITGDFNQTDSQRFSDESRGFQCTAISVLAACYSYNTPIVNWKTDDLNEILTIGDEFYKVALRQQTAIHKKIESKYLAVEHMYSYAKINRKIYSISEMYKVDLKNLERHYMQNKGTFENLCQTLKDFFEEPSHACGIFTFCQYSFAIFQNENVYFMLNSHSCGTHGFPTAPGTAVLCQTFSIECLAFRLLKSCGTSAHLGNQNEERIYFITALDIRQRIFQRGDQKLYNKIVRDLMMTEEKEAQKAKNAETHRINRSLQSDKESRKRKTENAKSNQISQSNQSPEAKRKKQSRNTVSPQKIQRTLSAEKRNQVKSKNTPSHRDSRTKETAQQRDSRLEDMRQRKKVTDLVQKEKSNEKSEFSLLKNQFKLDISRNDIITRFLANDTNNIKVRIESEKVVNKAYDYRESTITSFIRNYLLFKEKWLAVSCKVNQMSNADEKFTAIVGPSMHTRHSEAYFVDTAYNKLSGMFMINDHGRLANMFEFAKDFNSWKCNSDICKINKESIIERFTTWIKVVLDLEPKDVETFFRNIDYCSNNDNEQRKRTCKCKINDCEHIQFDNFRRQQLGHPEFCYADENNCDSMLLFLRSISPHFSFIRQVVGQVYRIQRQLREIETFKDGLLQCDLSYLKEISANIVFRGTTEFIVSGYNFTEESQIYEQFYDAFYSMKEVEADWPINTCMSCRKMLRKKTMRGIPEDFDKKPQFRELRLFNEQYPINHLVNDQEELICLYCYNKFRLSELPPTCILNHLDHKTAPECISKLNPFETVFIQRAKAFATITTMGTVAGGHNKKRPNANLNKKIKGRMFHLPLPMQATLAKLPDPTDAILENQELYIHVRGVPTKQNKISESLVNVKNVYEALIWLKTNNPLYKDVQLPLNIDSLRKDINETISVKFWDPEKFNEETEEEEENDAHTVSIEEKAMITQKETSDDYYENMTIYPLFEHEKNISSTEIYQMLKVIQKSIDNRDSNLDLKCFPDLFCYGENGQNEVRKKKLEAGEFAKCLLMSCDSRFRLNLQYLFFLLQNANFRQINAGIFHKLNITAAKPNLNAKSFRLLIESNCEEMRTNLMSIFGRLRNTQQYWKKYKNDLDCMVAHYGPATFFLTLSPSEYYWEDLYDYLCLVNGTTRKKSSLASLIAKDPVSASRFIDLKFQAIMAFITSSKGPFGVVEHFAWRREYQTRGLQHFHILLWVKNAPILGENTLEEVTEFISKHISCKLPSKSNFPTLHKRIMDNQIHKHNQYCMRSKKNKQGQFVKVCRFGFPRKIGETLTISSVAEAILGRRSLSRKRLFNLPRTEQEAFINDYNPIIALLWNGNMDIQYIGEKSGALTAYITKYQTKSEKSNVTDSFSSFIGNCVNSVGSNLWKFALSMLNNRECGALEASDTLLQIPLFGKDNSTVVRWLDVGQNRSRKVKPKEILAQMADDDEEIFAPNWIDTHYPNRPKELEHLSLYDFSRWFDIVKSKPQHKNTIFYPYGDVFLRHRNHNPYLINHFKFNPNQQPEEYYYSLLLLFKPWRNINELKTCGNYTLSFAACKDNLSEAMKYHDKLEEIKRAKEELEKEIEEKQIELDQVANEMSDSEAEDDFLDFEQRVEKEMQDLNGQVKEQSAPVEELIKQLNSDQLRIFKNVVEAVEKYCEEMEISHPGYNARSCPENVLRQFVSGVGGTGKSFLIHVIRLYLVQKTKKEVAVCAPTGIAAFNINGLTIHRLLGLPVERNGEILKYTKLSSQKLHQIREDLRNVILIIIDEVSMVSNLMLAFIHLRLSEIFETFDEQDGYFGRVNLLLFGDLLQIPPVKANSPFIKLSTEDVKKHIHSLASIELWKGIFTYDELTENVRQKSDIAYAKILNNIRLGILSASDEEVLRSKMIKLDNRTAADCLQSLVVYIKTLPLKTVCLFSTRAQCTEINNRILESLESTEYILKCKDDIEGQRSAQRNKARDSLEKQRKDATKTAGLEDEIKVKIGAKVMLLRNIDISIGLVNGAIGILRDVHKNLHDRIDKLIIQFESGEWEIEPVQSKFEIFSNVYVIRRQFPICVAYAITIHKSQGLTVESCVVDVGDSIFITGQAYVALSRVTSLNGLNIINLNPAKIKAQNDAILEYNRLRKEYTNHSAIEVNNQTNRVIGDKNRYIENDEQEAQVEMMPDDVIVDEKKKQKAKLVQNLNIRGFVNSDHRACFANAFMQCLLNIKSFERCALTAAKSPLKQVFLDANNSSLTSPINLRTLRQEFQQQMTLDRQHDPAEFLSLLFDKYPFMKIPCKYTVIHDFKCTSASCQHTFSSQPVDGFMEMLSIPDEEKTFKMDELVANNFDKWQIMDGGKCTRCNSESLHSKRRLQDTNDVIIFALQLSGGGNNYLQKRVGVHISGISQTELTFGANYTLSGAVFHVGPSFDSDNGHYTAILRKDKQLFLANDQTISTCIWPKNGKDVYMLFYTKT